MKIISEFLKGFVFIHKIYNYSKDSKRIISRSELGLSSISENFNKNLFNLKSTSNLKIKDKTGIPKNTPSVAGWVPYIKNKTKIVIYNFFSVNYSLRKIIFVRISIIDNQKICLQDSFWMNVNSIIEHDLTGTDKNIDGQSVVVEIFHPNIKINHGGQNGHLRFWGKYYKSDGKYTSTVHSMPFPKNNYYITKNSFSRCYSLDKLTNENNYSKIFSIGNSEIMDKNDKKKYYPGFNVSFDNEHNPLSVWHLAPFDTSHYKNLDNNSKKMYQSFWVPDVDKLDPIIVIDNRELGVLGNHKVKFFILKNNEIIEQKEIEFDTNLLKAKISKIFNKQISGEYILICEINFNNFGYINVHYSVDNNLNDQVHAHLSSWDIKENKAVPKVMKSRGSARKFFHVFKNENNIIHYLIIHIHNIENKEKIAIKVRALSDTNFEYIKNYEINVNNPIYVVNIEKDFFEFTKNINSVGVVQFESNDDNFDGSMMFYDSLNKNIAVDHLTGG